MEGSQRSPAPIAGDNQNFSLRAHRAEPPPPPASEVSRPSLPSASYGRVPPSPAPVQRQSRAETTRATDGSWRPLSCKWVWIQPNARRHCHCWAVTQPKVDEGGG